MRRFLPRFACLLTFCLVLLGVRPARGNSDIFPPLPDAQSVDHWGNGYFVLNGRPTFVNSGSIHYARAPRELWEDRIWRLKQRGFNCAQSYVFWNATEPREGQFDLTDKVDFGQKSFCDEQAVVVKTGEQVNAQTVAASAVTVSLLEHARDLQAADDVFYQHPFAGQRVVEGALLLGERAGLAPTFVGRAALGVACGQALVAAVAQPVRCRGAPADGCACLLRRVVRRVRGVPQRSARQPRPPRRPRRGPYPRHPRQSQRPAKVPVLRAGRSAQRARPVGWGFRRQNTHAFAHGLEAMDRCPAPRGPRHK